MRESDPSLNQPLPAAVAVGSSRWWLSYRNYPVFSWPWVWRRALLFGLLVVAWGGLSAIMHYAQGGTASEAWMLFAAFTSGLLVMVNAGPVLAAIVRHRRPPPRLERYLVVAAIATGLVLAFLADMLSSNTIGELTGQELERQLNPTAIAINLVVLLIIYTFIGGGLALGAYLGEARRLADFRARRAVQRLQSEKLAADQQLAVLQAQVEPHFLFNTLATIRSSLRGDPDRAEATLDALCEYLRATIPRLHRTEDGEAATLDEQLEICRRYLTLMQLRMGQRLDFTIEADDAAKALGFPPFILLSLVENAICHGLEPKTSGGRVTVHARLDDGRLRVTVADTGVGLHGTPGGGVGLENVRRQLALRYGDRAQLRLEGDPEGGVRACIIVPVEAMA